MTSALCDALNFLLALCVGAWALAEGVGRLL